MYRWIIAILFSLSMGCTAPKLASSPAPSVQPNCFSMFRLDARDAMLISMLQFYHQHEGRPYIDVIIENWLLVRPVEVIRRGNMTITPCCEESWQWGDLNSDGRVDYEDIAIYGCME